MTEGRIMDLLEKDVLTELIRLVLVNAIYFKDKWRKLFENNATRKESFYLATGKNIQLFISSGIPAQETLRRWASLSGHNGADLLKLIRNCRTEKVDVSLPKWKMETSFELSGKLKALGVLDAFDGGTADFSLITDEPKDKLCISAVIHKAFIEVDEKGSEASAATALSLWRRMSNMPPPPEPKTFRADHPFFFAIASSEHILFSGVLSNP